MAIVYNPDQDFAQFTLRLKRQAGIDLALYKQNQMQRRIMSFKDRMGFASLIELFRAMMEDESLYRRFLDQMTINVSEFYRNARYWEVLEKRILPELFAKFGRLKCWSAACSTGEEPYTMAMVLSSVMNLADIRVLATDLDQGALARAAAGKYAAASVKEVPKMALNKFFSLQDNEYAVAEEIKRCVQFRRQNLLADPFETGFDLIVCRNVTIYFTDEAKDQLYHKFSRSLKKGGYLFVGCTEQLFNPGEYGFTPAETFFYRKN